MNGVLRECERCGMVFSEGFADCPLCGGALQPRMGEDGEVWVVVAVFANRAEAEIVGGLFQAEGIPFVVTQRGVSMYPAPGVGLDLVLVLVPDGYLPQAVALQRAAQRGELALAEEEQGEGE